jgi:hypothetical protein
MSLNRPEPAGLGGVANLLAMDRSQGQAGAGAEPDGRRAGGAGPRRADLGAGAWGAG